ncbi:hypothetical protein ACGFS9_15105 [Streptomyces sp. NPDC048566]|uniref:hypothetical protein n=1 Tax=Streptomyces sp. NPDC048566 TaxID=3365569 RepID=UPI0037145B95
MTVEQLPQAAREFASYLNGLMQRLDQGGGWCGIFWQRDPDGMRACLDGWETPPWDVVQALLHDLAAEHGDQATAQETDHARTLHHASLAAHDARPGARDTLRDRLDVMLREQRYAAERQAELTRLLHTATTHHDTETLRLDLAWAHDDHARATARCTELRHRINRLDHHPTPPPPAAHPAPSPQHTPTTPGDDPRPPTPPEPPTRERPTAQRKRRTRGSARFAGMTAPDTEPTPTPDTTPAHPTPTAPGHPTPRGARFAGAAEHPPPPPGRPTHATPPDDDTRHHTAQAVATLTRLRGQGHSGEAHALLAEAAHWPAARFPHLAAELHRHGLDADWTTLLWEAASLPADHLVAAADALTTAGRTTDGHQLLRQGVARPAPEIGSTALALADQGRHRELAALLDAYLRVRTPEEAARSAQPDPHRLVPLLLDAARTISDETHWDLVHALRVAGHTT